MGWKEWPGWFRIGNIGGVISFIGGLFYLIRNPMNCADFYCLNVGGSSCCTSEYFLSNLSHFLPLVLIIAIFLAAIGFLIGAFIGWIIGIIKKNKNNK